MTQDEAQAEAIADGIRADQITPQILAFYGYVSPLPTEGGSYGPADVPSNVTASLERLQAEQEANSLPTQILSEITTLLGFAKQIGWLLVVVSVLAAFPGCSSTEAQSVNQQQSVLVQALNNQWIDYAARNLKYYRDSETNRVNDLYNSAMTSAAVKDASGTLVVPVNVAEALQTQRLRALTGIATQVQAMQAQQAQICTNYAMFAQYNAGLQAYFQQQSVNFAALQAGQDAILGFLASFMAKPAAK
jgi:hypothetical protein